MKWQVPFLVAGGLGCFLVAVYQKKFYWRTRIFTDTEEKPMPRWLGRIFLTVMGLGYIMMAILLQLRIAR